MKGTKKGMRRRGDDHFSGKEERQSKSMMVERER